MAGPSTDMSAKMPAAWFTLVIRGGLAAMAKSLRERKEKKLEKRLPHLSRGQEVPGQRAGRRDARRLSRCKERLDQAPDKKERETEGETVQLQCDVSWREKRRRETETEEMRQTGRSKLGEEGKTIDCPLLIEALVVIGPDQDLGGWGVAGGGARAPRHWPIACSCIDVILGRAHSQYAL